MKTYLVRLVLGAALMLLLTPALSFASPLNQGAPEFTPPANHKEISGDPLGIQVGENGSIQVYHKKTGDKGATYGSADSGFFLAIGTDIYSPDLYGTNSDSAFGVATNKLDLVSHEGPTGSGTDNDPFKIVTQQNLDGSGATLGVVQTVSYINGKNNFRQDWDITNSGSSEVCFNAYHAADIYFAGSDTGVGYYNPETGSVGGKGQDNEGNDWFMVFTPVTKADHYQEGEYSYEIWDTVKAGGDLGDSIDPSVVDNGIALQWKKCLQPGETTTISDRWSFGEDEKEVIPDTLPTPSTNSRGDVHLFTPDGLIYDFQSTGEFLAVQSSDQKVIVQARQESWEQNPRASINTAVALWVDGDKLEFYVKPERSFYINDVLTDLPSSTLALPGGGDIALTPGTVSDASRSDLIIRWPDRSFKARVVMHAGGYMDYGIVATEGSQTYAGVLGNLDGNAQNDIQIQGGDVITPPANATDLNSFGNSWLLPAAESLFQDPTGQTDTRVHVVTMQEIDEDDRAQAEETCQTAGVSEQTALRDCTYDVAMTGDDTFVESALVFEESTKDLPPSAKIPAQPGETLSGAIFDANQALTIMDGDDVVITTGKSADGTSYLRFNIHRNGEYVASYSVGTDAAVADSVTEAMAPAPASAPAEPSGENLALLAIENAASTDESNELISDMAFDGDSETRWSSDYDDPQWVAIDLGGVYNIDSVVLNWEAAYAVAYEIQVSFDAENWETIYSTSEGAGGIEELPDLSGTGQFIRMYGTERGTEWGYSLWEFEVYGSWSND